MDQGRRKRNCISLLRFFFFLSRCCCTAGYLSLNFPASRQKQISENSQGTVSSVRQSRMNTEGAVKLYPHGPSGAHGRQNTVVQFNVNG